MSTQREEQNLKETLNRLTTQVSEAHARLRQAKRTLLAKQTLLTSSREVLHQDFKNVMTMRSMRKRKRRRIMPLPGLVPVVGSPTSIQNQQQQKQPYEDNPMDVCPVLIKTCMGWVRGTRKDRIWIRVEACNTLSTVLYAAFTCLPDVFWSDLKNSLRVTCRFIYDETEWSCTPARSIEWVATEHDRGWIQENTATLLAPVCYPSYIGLAGNVSSEILTKQGFQHIFDIEEMTRQVYLSQDQDLLMIAGKETIALYGLTERDVILCMKRLRDNECSLRSVGMLSNEGQILQNVLLALHDETQYLGKPWNTETNRSILAARQNTIDKLSCLFEMSDA
ncbi:hypothetical protein EC973_001153 [Apophysomyces ossiformis]|uniref:Uncharacterized protein n=1 Tax=Apophysomyces ossiformis TaxID=679940 RepID=A0A8H7BME9_9FUNG|nr:hypothetical protein EC973_001153 [Apophysomyces ossiformis]